MKQAVVVVVLLGATLTTFWGEQRMIENCRANPPAHYTNRDDECQNLGRRSVTAVAILGISFLVMSLLTRRR